MEKWRYKAKAVTKYNPIDYDKEGNYAIEDWTSYSDVGKIIDRVTHKILTKERYLEVEDNYIQAVKLFLLATKAKKISIVELFKISDMKDFEKNNDNNLFSIYTYLEHMQYPVTKIGNIVRLALREYIQVTLQFITPKMDSYVHFGYDYYMYFVSDSINFDNLKEELLKFQMFVD